MSSHPTSPAQQLRLLPAPDPTDHPSPAPPGTAARALPTLPAVPGRRPRRQGGRNVRMAARLDALAAACERDAMHAVVARDEPTARDALERAAAARRAARILRAGPDGVRSLMAS